MAKKKSDELEASVVEIARDPHKVVPTPVLSESVPPVRPVVIDHREPGAVDRKTLPPDETVIVPELPPGE